MITSTVIQMVDKYVGNMYILNVQKVNIQKLTEK